MQEFQFLQQFKLNFRHKLGKKHIISDVLGHLVNVNISHIDLQYLELNALITYNTILAKIYLALVSQLLASYKVDLW